MWEVIVWIAAAFISAQIIAYWLHRLLHSGRIAYLSKSHMFHHMCEYGPKMPQRSPNYKLAVSKRMAVLGIGMEWIIPGTIIYGLIVLALLSFGVTWQIIVLFIAVSLTLFWSVDYFHNSMHLEGFWLIRTPLGKLFLRLRHRHDLHHTELDNIGRMYLNFGITSFVTDRLFGTFSEEAKPFNELGFHAAEERYALMCKIYGENE